MPMSLRLVSSQSDSEMSCRARAKTAEPIDIPLRLSESLVNVSVQNCDTLTLFKSRLKAHLFPPSMLLNWPVRQRLWSHGNMALYKFCVVLLYCLWTHVGTRNHVLDWGIKIGATWQIRQIDLFGSGNAALCEITLSFIKILTPRSVE